MDSVGFYILENLESEEENERAVRQSLRGTARDIFEMDERSFMKNFRLNKSAFKYVLGEVEKSCPKATKSNSLSIKIKLAATLRFLAQGSYQQSVGNELNIAQSTFSEIFSSMLNILQEKLCSKWITIKQTDSEKMEAKQHFYEKCGIPGVVMCVDDTHIKIIQPKDNKHLYYNRKGFYSLNTMIVCDHQQRIKFVDGRYQGANHDSHIWSLSDAREYFKNLYDSGDKHTRILGDSGYPLEPWLLTPFRNVSEGTVDRIFNRKHSTGRIVVERTIGLLKNRFRCLHEMRALHYDASKVVRIINVCCALHNICLHYGISTEDDVIQESASLIEETNDVSNSSYYNEEAVEIRRRIANSFR